jgi:cysteine-rich repeat protein
MVIVKKSTLFLVCTVLITLVFIQGVSAQITCNEECLTEEYIAEWENTPGEKCILIYEGDAYWPDNDRLGSSGSGTHRGARCGDNDVTGDIGPNGPDSFHFTVRSDGTTYMTQSYCAPICTNECGDGVLEEPEQCDDGGVVSGDGCDSDCKIETVCGDGVTEGDEICELEETLGCLVATSGCETTTSSWTNFDLDAQTSDFEIQWEMTPSASSVHSFIGFSDGQQSDYGGYSMLVRFDSPGVIDVRNGGVYGSDTTVNYASGTVYSFRAVVDVTANTYSIYVTPGSGSEVALATDYAFRVSATEINNWGIYSNTGTSEICSLVITSVDGVVQAGAGQVGVRDCNDQCTGYGACISDGTTPTQICGNAEVESGEQCDDGNTIPGDGCSEICRIEIVSNETNLTNSGNETGAGNMSNPMGNVSNNETDGSGDEGGDGGDGGEEGGSVIPETTSNTGVNDEIPLPEVTSESFIEGLDSLGWIAFGLVILVFVALIFIFIGFLHNSGNVNSQYVISQPLSVKDVVRGSPLIKASGTGASRFSIMCQEFAPIVLRVTMGFVFAWFGVSQLQNPNRWIGYLPEFAKELFISPANIIVMNGIYDTLLGLVLVLGIFTRFIAFVSAVHLLIITIDIGYTATGVRDFGLTFALFVTFLLGPDKWSLDTVFAKNFPRIKTVLKILCIGAILAVLIVVTLLMGSFTPNELNTNIPQQLPQVPDTNTIEGTDQILLTPELVAQHNTPDDCWMIIQDKVYDPTMYMASDLHPGGYEIMEPLCGKDATEAFISKEGTGEDHTPSAYLDLDDYYIGVVGDVYTG